MRLSLIAAISALLITSASDIYSLPSAAAETAPPSSAPSAPAAATNADPSQQTPAAQFIQNLGNQAITIMADKSLSPDQRTQKYRNILHNSFDMPTIGHFVLARAWNTATPDQQNEFMKLFEQLVLKTYGDRLNFYSGEGFQVKSSRQESDKDSIVGSEISHSDGSSPTKVDWRIRQESGKLAVIDVIIEGVSQSVTQRDEYAAIIQRNGGNINALLDLMRQRTQETKQDTVSQNP